MEAADERERPRPGHGLGYGSSAYRKLANGSLRISSFAEIDAKVRSGAYQYHEFPLGFVITEIKEFGGRRALQVVLLLGSRFEEWKGDVVSHLVEFGKAHGCATLEALCRRGLERVLKPLGWKKKKVLLEKDI